MELVRVEVNREWREGQAARTADAPLGRGRLTIGDARAELEALLPEWTGKIKLVYLDPPYLTGEKFSMRVRVGEDEWKSGKGTLALPAFEDTKNREAYLSMMRPVLVLCHKLLSDDGMLFLHIDYRAHPYMRLMLDEIFSESNFLNEIIWVYLVSYTHLTLPTTSRV